MTIGAELLRNFDQNDHKYEIRAKGKLGI
jgi:hypothetical protein